MANTIVIKDLLMKETIKLLDKNLVQVQFCNRAFEGELKKQGDAVTVQTFPNLTITTGGTAGADISSQNFTITGENLTVDQVAQANVEIRDVEALRSNLALNAKTADRLAYQLAKTYDTFVMYKALATTNIVPTVALTKSNIYASIEAMGVILDNNDVPSDSRVLFVNPADASLIRQAPEWDGFREGADMRIKGYVGEWAGFKIYKVTTLPANHMYAMQDGAINFVEQFNDMKITDALTAFRYNIVMETYFGAKVFTENAKKIVKFAHT